MNRKKEGKLSSFPEREEEEGRSGEWRKQNRRGAIW